MFIKSFVVLLLLTISSFASSKSFDYYSDGVYDAYTEIENSLRRGLKEEKIKDLGSKWLVLQDISNDSTVQIIFYRTVAHKNNFFEAVIAKRKDNNKNYMVYGAYSRKADAQYASKKLLEKGISAKVVYSRGDDEYNTNPIVVKKLIVDMKKLLKDTPVVVVRRTEILDSAPVTQKQIQCKKAKPKIIYKSKGVGKSKIVRSEFAKLKVKWKRRATVDTKEKVISYKERSGYINHFKIKDYFKGFKITDIYFSKKTGYAVVKVMGIDGKTYKLYEKKKQKKDDCAELKKEKTKAAHHKEIKKNNESKGDSKSFRKNKVQNNADESGLYLCDFNKINVAYLKGSKRVNVRNTHYYKKILKVKVSKEKGLYKIQYSGYETIFIKPFYFKQCKKL